MKKLLTLLFASLMLLSQIPVMAEETPITISLHYSDNPTLPFREDWPALRVIQEKNNVRLNIEALPMADFGTKVSLALSIWSFGCSHPESDFNNKKAPMGAWKP